MKLFEQVKVRKPKSSVFDLSHEKKLSMNMGELVPILLQETLPGDSMRCNTEQIIRFHPMLAPIMHRIDAYIHYFYVPNRLVFEDWDKFITGGETGNDATPFPTIDLDSGRNFGKGTLADYLGIPSPSGTVTVTKNINALPFRAYQLIYNEYFRDQNLVTEVPITKLSTVSEPEEAELIQMRKRAWTKDYFTSALPWAQKGGSVLLPSDITYMDPAHIRLSATEDQSPTTAALQAFNPGAGADLSLVGGQGTARLENIEDLGVTINDLRTANKLQEWLEKNARAGSRLFESLLVHFGVLSDDLRIGRPRYLGGARVPVTVSEVLATNETTELTLGQMGGHGISIGNQAGFKAKFKEHGFVMGIMSIIPKPSYMQGLHKLWTRFDKLDYAWPEFANLGEQEIKNSEIFVDWADDSDNEKTFGYTPRYSEYKFGFSTVHGDFKDNLSYWHAGRIFTNRPILVKAFIEADTSTIDNRIFPVSDSQTTDKLYCQIYHNIQARRPLPYFGTPKL